MRIVSVGAWLLLLLLLPGGTPAAARVVNSSSHGFELRYSHVIPGSPASAMQAFAKLDSWWDSDHTYSGSAGNLSLSLEPGGCFCEKLPGGGVEHMRVAFVEPGKRIVLTGALGPLLTEATTGVLDVRFVPAGTGTTVTATYKVAGFANGGAATLAPLVDQVVARQFGLFATYATPPAPSGQARSRVMKR